MQSISRKGTSVVAMPHGKSLAPPENNAKWSVCPILPNVSIYSVFQNLPVFNARYAHAVPRQQGRARPAAVQPVLAARLVLHMHRVA